MTAQLLAWPRVSGSEGFAVGDAWRFREGGRFGKLVVSLRDGRISFGVVGPRAMIFDSGMMMLCRRREKTLNVVESIDKTEAK